MASMTFDNVTQAIWNCVQTTSVNENGTVYNPPPPSNSGTATTKIPFVGTVELSFTLDSGQETVTYTIIKKPGIVSDDRIWEGIQETINGCTPS